MLRLSAVAFLLLVPLTCVRAQSTNASVTGRITDPSKAPIAEAKVAAINTGTNVLYEASTNTAGEYVLANLPPGGYRIEIEKTGFKKLIKPDVILHVQDAFAIDFEMTLGEVSESVTAATDVLPMDTASGTVSTVVDHAFVEDMPLNGRSSQTLILLTPGVVVTATASNNQGQFSVNGQRTDANYFTVDGVSANFGATGYLQLVQTAGGSLPALSALGGTNSLVSVDAMQEFRIQTSSFTPEFGRAPGGQVSIVTRSGTNAFHGTAFDYFRNSVLDANDWFVNFNHLPKPQERQNDFGGVVGGPVIKDKTFFFFSYEGLRLRQPFTQETVVPDTASRQQAPATMQPFLNAYPIQNGAELGAGLAQFNGSYSNPASLDAYSIRLDHVINSKFTLFGRYNYSPSNTEQRGPALGAGSELSSTQSSSFSVQTLTVGLTQIINQEISNEIRANYSNDRVGVKYGMDNLGGAAPLPDSLLFPMGYSSTDSVFLFVILGAGEIFKGKDTTNEQRQVNLVDNLSVTTGSHQLKFGVDYRWLAPFTSPFANEQFAEFSGMGTAPGGALSGTIPGATTTALFATSQSEQSSDFLSHNLSFYGQDTWKITPRLTLTYGLRWDINPSLKGKNLANDPYTVVGLNDPATMSLAPHGTPLYNTTYGNVAPRLGLAYRFSGIRNWEAVFRGGFGIFYDLGSGSLGAISSYFPYSQGNSYSDVPYPLSAQEAAAPVPVLSPPPAIPLVVVADPHLKLPRTYQWNFALEQSLGSSQSISVTYAGAVGRDLLRQTILRPQLVGNPDFTDILLTDNTATSDYNALQIKFQRRLSGGLQALASYTFSHSIDIASTDALTLNNTPAAVSSPNVDRGDSDFDIRHSFTAGVTYDLPSPESNKIAHAALGGWSLDSFVMARSAPPVDLIGAFSFIDGTEFETRPNVVPGVPLVLYGPQYPGGKAFNNTVIKGACPGGKNQIGALCPAPAGTQGNFGRNVLRGFGATQADVAFQRQFHLTERMSLRFRSEFFNIFNHPNFGNPNNTLTSPLFGRSTQTLASSLGSGGANGGFNPLYQIGGPRSIQLALKLQF